MGCRILLPTTCFSQSTPMYPASPPLLLPPPPLNGGGRLVRLLYPYPVAPTVVAKAACRVAPIHAVAAGPDDRRIRSTFACLQSRLVDQQGDDNHAGTVLCHLRFSKPAFTPSRRRCCHTPECAYSVSHAHRRCRHTSDARVHNESAKSTRVNVKSGGGG